MSAPPPLARALQDLHAEAGSPSYKALHDSGGPAPSTTSDWLTGRARPREADDLLLLVDTIRRSARHLPPRLVDPVRWRRLHAESSTPEPEPPRAKAPPSTPTWDPRPASELPSHWVKHAEWMHLGVMAAPNPRMWIFGAVDSGKTTFFQHLERSQPHRESGVVYRYIDLLRRTGRARDDLWAELSSQLGFSLTAATTPARLSDRFASDGITRVVLVLDNWDDARRSSGSFIDPTGLEELVDVVHSSQMDSDAPVRLGMVCITRFPSVRYFITFARASSSPDLWRISGDLQERSFTASSFPFLGMDAAQAIAEAAGCPPELVEAVAGDSGGWLGLLVAAVGKARDGGRWDVAARRQLEPEIESLLSKTLLPEVARQYGDGTTQTEAWQKVLKDVAGGAPASRYALPPADEAADRRNSAVPLSRLLADFRAPPSYVVVDLENLCRRFEIHGQASPAAYPDGVHTFVRDAVPRAIRYAAETYDVPPENVVIASKNLPRAGELLGVTDPGWKIICADIDTRKGQRSEHDDSTAIAFIAGEAARCPAATFVILTEDQGHPAVLRPHVRCPVVLWTPFEAPRSIQRFRDGGWSVRENLFPQIDVSRPAVNPTAQ
jgi:hypothetical protein